MAGQEREGWFEREEFIGQISDMRVQNLQVEREVVQKRTFTRWMNLHLEKCDPPLQVQDLFCDIQDGHILMVLLEELSGCRLLHGFKKSSHRIFRLNNIAKVLSFLEERNVKLVSIDAADVADGNSSIILGLIWNIILFFQIKELTGNIRSQFPSSSSLSSIPTSADSDTPLCSSPSNEGQSASTAMRENSKVIKRLLQWVQRRTRKFGVAVKDFGRSWISGLAFLAVIKSIDSSLVDMRKALLRTARENLEDAFRIALYSLGIPRLLEPEDVMINAPDEQSIMTYVSQFLEHFPGREEMEGPHQPFERSISFCRLNLCEGDSDHVRNDGHGSRVKEMSYMFQRDFVKPPPKILISSGSEDRGTRPHPLRSPAARSWSSEDFLADSPRLEGVSSNTAKELKESANEILISSTFYSSVQSPMGSSVSESVNTEPAIGDSAISSPESWVDSEFGVMPEKFCESQSDSLLCGSLTAWDVYRATPVEITTLDEGFVPSLEDRSPDEQPITDSYIDEGIGSLSSMESTRDRIHPGKEKVEVFRVTEASLMEHNQDMAFEQEPDHRAEITEEDSEQAETSVTQKGVVPREPSSGRCDLEVNTGVPDLSQLMSNTDSPPLDHLEDLMRPTSVADGYDEEQECLMDALGFSGEVQDTEGQVNGLADSRIERKNSDVETVAQNKAQNKEVLRDYLDPQESFRSEIYDALASTQPDNQGERSMTSLNSGGTYTPNHEFPSSLLSEDLKATSWEQRGVIESENLADPGDQTIIRSSHGDTVDNMEISEEKQEQHDFLTGHYERDFTALTINVQCQADSTGEETKLTDQLDGQPDKPDESVSDIETASSQQIILDPVSWKLIGRAGTPWCEEGGVSRDVDTFYTHFDQHDAREDLGGGRLEPMDLFYPDSEEPMFPEPPDADLQSWPSVLSVSALQPALASEALPDSPPLLVPDEEWREDLGGIRVVLKPENDQVTTQTSQEADEASESQERVWLSAEKKQGLWDDDGVPADCSDLTEDEQQGSGFESVRTDTKGSSRWDEKQNPPVLRYRWGPRSAESTDTQTVPNGPADHWRSNSWELDVLLLLWLLLYCWWLLPQVDLKMLLLNLHQ